MRKKGLKSAVLAASVAAMFSVSTGVQAAEVEGTTDAGTEAEQAEDQDLTEEQEQTEDQTAADQEETETKTEEVTEVEEETEDVKSDVPAETKTGWQQESNGKWRYWYMDGETNTYYQSCTKKIGTAWYGFDWNGYMYSNTTFYQNSKKYKAKEDGKLYVNAWIYEDEDAYYAGADGAYLMGETVTYKGKMYYLQSWGSMLVNGSSNGYRAREDGSLYVSTWYSSNPTSEWADWYYYGSDGKAVDGVVQINGKYYIFNYNVMLRNGSYSDGTNVWVSNKDGVATKLANNSWSYANDKYYYVSNGELYSYEFATIGGSTYFFNWDGSMADDTEVYYEENYYRLKPGGKLCKNEWYQQNEWSPIYYYGADGARVKGVQTINGKKYYFADYNGLMVSGTAVVKGVGYVADAKGVLTEVTAAGWVAGNGGYYYFTGEDFYEGTVRKIGNSWYGFDYSGMMYDNEEFYMNGYSYRAKKGGALYVNAWYGNYAYLEEGKAANGFVKLGNTVYSFDDDGLAAADRYIPYEGALYYADNKCKVTKVTKDGFYFADANRRELYYVSGGKLLTESWQLIAGKYYYFGEDGEAYMDGKYEIGGKMYLFNSDGTMMTAGVVKFSGNTYYVTGSGALQTGAKKLGSKWYYFGEYGEMQTGLVKVDDALYLYGHDGAYIGAAKGNGWNAIDGAWYYVEDGDVVTDYFEVGNVGYYADDDGRMLKETTRYVYSASGTCLFNSSGKRVRSGWYLMGGSWYYVDPDTEKIVSGKEYTIGGKKYYFDYSGRMKVSDTKNYSDGKDHIDTIDKSGVITKETELKTGWAIADGNYYYYKDGKGYNGWVGNYYISSGRMLRNGTTPDGYYVGQTGVYEKTAGWVVQKTLTGSWKNGMYKKSGGKLAKNEWLTIGGKKYYFDDYYRVEYLQRINGVWYIFSGDGELLVTLGSMLPEGWKQAGSDWYYFRGQEVIYGSLTIGGKIYTFNESRMEGAGLTWGSSRSYENNSSGQAIANSGWKLVDGSWYYFQRTNQTDRYGWLTEGGKFYYFDYSGAVTGYQVIDSKLYYFNASGALTTSYTVQEGWKLIGGNYYYFQNGDVLHGTVATISGKTYLFDYDGKLAKNTAVSQWYADANGVIVTNTWKTIDGVKYYFGADGRRLTGVQNIGGTVYYLDY